MVPATPVVIESVTLKENTPQQLWRLPSRSQKQEAQIVVMPYQEKRPFLPKMQKRRTSNKQPAGCNTSSSAPVRMKNPVLPTESKSITAESWWMGLNSIVPTNAMNPSFLVSTRSFPVGRRPPAHWKRWQGKVVHPSKLGYGERGAGA